MSRRKLSQYQRIVRAARDGHGVRLSYEDCFVLSCDDAIRTVAAHDDEDPEWADKIDAPDDEEET